MKGQTMNATPPNPLANDDELTRKLMSIPYHRRWCLDVSIAALSVIDRRAPWAARIIKPVVPVIGGALRIVADALLQVELWWQFHTRKAAR
jgi:hypothetical protein